MKKSVKILLSILCLTIGVSVFVGCSGKEGNNNSVYFVVDNRQYVVTDEDNAKVKLVSSDVSGENGERLAETVPTAVSYEGKTYSVTTIGANAYLNEDVTFLRIPDSVVKIERYAFAHCSAQEVYFGRNVQSIGDHAFADCLRLQTVAIVAAHPPTLGDEVFRYYDRTARTYLISDRLTILTPTESEGEYKTSWAEYAGNVRPGAENE